jgi:hypothetical protein
MATHIEAEGSCFTGSDEFSGEIHSASSELKKNYENTKRQLNHFMKVTLFYV